MPFERCEGPRFVPVKNAQETLSKNVAHFQTYALRKSGDEVLATLAHRSEGVDLVTMTGRAQRTSGEPEEVLVFDALKQATGNSLLETSELTRYERKENHVLVEFLDSDGTLWHSKAQTFEQAVTDGLSAVFLQY